MTLPILTNTKLSAGREATCYAHRDSGSVALEFDAAYASVRFRVSLSGTEARAIAARLIEAADLVAPTAVQEAA